MDNEKQESLNKINRYAVQHGKSDTYDVLMEEVLWEVLSTPVEDIWEDYDELEFEDDEEYSLNEKRNNTLKEIRVRVEALDMNKDEKLDFLVNDILPIALEKSNLSKVSDILWEWEC